MEISHTVINKIILGDNIEVLKNIESNSIDLIYVDPPFNTKKERKLVSIRTTRDVEGDRTGFAGNRYKSEIIGTKSYNDNYDNYLEFIEPRIREAHRVLTESGSFFFHIDHRESHYCKVLIDTIFDRKNFINEIIWSYDYGARSKRKWSNKHDTILFYAKNANNYTFNYDEIDRIPYLAPALVGDEKAKRGKTPTDVWWNTIVPTSGKEKTGYPTQKPLAILERIIRVHSRENELVLDFFAGSGTTGEAAIKNNRRFILIDSNAEAIDVMKRRLSKYDNIEFEEEKS